jgi:GTP-binding protein HflX
MSDERAIVVIKETTRRPPKRLCARVGPAARPSSSQVLRPAVGEQAAEELEELARSAGADVVGRLVQRSPSTDSRYVIGSGKALELQERARREAVDMVIFDADLTPAQTHHLEILLRVKVIDRTQLILDIFAQRARSREGQLQVELAQLRYLLPRLTGQGVLLSRLGGGIGTRGPGETKLEVDRRRIRHRIGMLEREIDQVARTRSIHRARRQHNAVPLVALVGYTNAGKSTVFNALTGAGVDARDRLFSTLDSTIRHVTLPHKTTIALSDTVGFVRRLPHALVAAFKATLEEVRHAHCLVHIIDRSHPEWQAQAEAVERVLEELGVASTPRVTVYNKLDRLADTARHGWNVIRDQTETSRATAAVFISALSRAGLPLLVDAIEVAVNAGIARYRLRIPAERGDVFAQLHANGRVLQCAERRGTVTMDVELTDQAIRQWGDQWAPFFVTNAKASARRAASVAPSVMPRL